jgi:hypothetical protein
MSLVSYRQLRYAVSHRCSPSAKIRSSFGRLLRPDHSYQRVFRDVIAEAQASGQVAAEINPKLATLWILGALNWLHRWSRDFRGLAGLRLLDRVHRPVSSTASGYPAPSCALAPTPPARRG